MLMKQKLFSILALLLMAVTGAKAEGITAASVDGTIGTFTDANGQTREGIVVTLGGEKYAIAMSSEADITGLTGASTATVGSYTYYSFADACTKFANGKTDGSYNGANVWRLPTDTEVSALINLGNMTWDSTEGHKGYTWTVGSGSLFLPAAGYYENGKVTNLDNIGYYWTSKTAWAGAAYMLCFYNGYHVTGGGGVTSGMPLRLFCRLPDIVETSYVGKVIAADGRMYKTVADANKYSTASGIVAYFGTSVVETGQEYKGIAISLDNMQYNPDFMLYCNHEDKSCSGHAYSDFATALTVKDGIATNAAVLATNADHGYSHQVASVPGANTSPRPAGASGWAVPSIGQWNLIMRGLTGYDLTQTANAALSAASVNAKLPTDATGFSQTLYWSNTEKDNKYVWVMQFTADGGLVSTTKKQTYVKTNYCRPMFAFTSAALACIVSYDANGGSDAPDEQVGDGGGTLTLSTTKPTREGYNFAGWNTAADGSGTTYAAGAELAVDNDVTLYAQWTEKIAKTLEETTDNQTWLATNDGKIYDVTLTRTLQTGGWNTFCAPFSTATPSGWTVKELSSSAFDSSTGELTLNFDNASSIEAGKPYLVKVTATVVNPVFEGVTISNTTTTTETTAVDFVPVMNPTNLTGGDKTVLFIIGGNKLTYPSGDGNINGFRAYFKLKDEVAAQASAFHMSFDDDATGITTVISDEPTTASGTYTLDGRRIEGQPTQKGVYIVNGKKVIK